MIAVVWWCGHLVQGIGATCSRLLAVNMTGVSGFPAGHRALLKSRAEASLLA